MAPNAVDMQQSRKPPMGRSIGIAVTGVAAALMIAVLWITTHRPAASDSRDERPLHEIVDMISRTVRVPKRPARLLSLCTSATDTVIALGVADRLVAIDEYGRVVPGAECVTVVGKGSAISREQVAALRVDLAFVWWYQDDVAKMLEDMAVPVVHPQRTGRRTTRHDPAHRRLCGLPRRG